MQPNMSANDQTGPWRFNHEAGAGQVVDARMHDHFALSVHEKMQKDHNDKVSFPTAVFTRHIEGDVAL